MLLDELTVAETAPEPTFTVTDTRPAVEDHDDELEEELHQRKHRPVFSGWCGPGPCRDGILRDANGATKRHCKGALVNGANVNPRIVWCACTCHDDPVLTDPAQTAYPAVGRAMPGNPDSLVL